MLSDEQADALNEATVLAMGWTSRQTFYMGKSPMMGRPDDVFVTAWDEPLDATSGTVAIHRSLPDFARDPAAFGHLLAWLAQQTNGAADTILEWELTCQAGKVNYSALLLRNEHQYYEYAEQGDTPGEALCRAIIAYAEQEAKNAQ